MADNIIPIRDTELEFDKREAVVRLEQCDSFYLVTKSKNEIKEKFHWKDLFSLVGVLAVTHSEKFREALRIKVNS